MGQWEGRTLLPARYNMELVVGTLMLVQYCQALSAVLWHCWDWDNVNTLELLCLSQAHL